MCIGLHVKHSLLLRDFNETLIFFNRFSKNAQISNSIKTGSVGAELFYADGWTDRYNGAESLFSKFYQRV